MKDFEGWPTNRTGEKEAVLKHFGYDWRPCKKKGPWALVFGPQARQWSGSRRCLTSWSLWTGRKKARVIFEYDPDFPTALLITQAALKVTK